MTSVDVAGSGIEDSGGPITSAGTIDVTLNVDGLPISILHPDHDTRSWDKIIVERGGTNYQMEASDVTLDDNDQIIISRGGVNYKAKFATSKTTWWWSWR